MGAPTDRENRFTTREGGATWPEDCSPNRFLQSKREMAHPVPTKGFLQLNPEAAMLSWPSVETCQPPHLALFAGANLSPKDKT